MHVWDAIVVGGGAAGFFTAINIKENNPDKSVLIIEKSSQLLGKVKISGGGRCNVTNATFTPKELVKNYPRGEKELLGPFHTFMTGDMMAWLSEHGVETKIEDDNRVFPESNSSQSIIDCFTITAEKLGVKLNLNEGLNDLKKEDDKWSLETTSETYLTHNVVIATGSSKQLWSKLENLEIKVIPPVPSLFTFNIKDTRIEGLMGLSVPLAEVGVNQTKLKDSGPLLITHWGMSGPAILKLSAWGALDLHALNYRFSISVNWIVESFEDTLSELKQQKENQAKKILATTPLFDLPKRLWESLIRHCKLENTTWANASKESLHHLAKELTCGQFQVSGKSTFKDEFVTAGGVDLKEVNFKTLGLKKHKGLFVVGEALNVDAITGGFNFQAAWTTSYIAAKTISR